MEGLAQISIIDAYIIETQRVQPKAKAFYVGLNRNVWRFGLNILNELTS